MITLRKKFPKAVTAGLTRGQQFLELSFYSVQESLPVFGIRKDLPQLLQATAL